MSAFDFLQLRGKPIAVFGVANRKSVAYYIGRLLEEAGASVAYVVKDEATRGAVQSLLPDRTLVTCDVEDEAQVAALPERLKDFSPLVGVVHSIAFADYDGFVKPFHETSRQQFLRAMDVSCYSLLAISNALRPILAPTASVVTISISTTRMASESYGFMAPVKAALDSSLAFLTKSFSRFSEVRFNAVAAGLLKTAASAGIPRYVDAYLYAEQVIPRGRALTTDEVAHTACFLLSPRSSGIAAQCVVVDAGMAINYFDQQLIDKAMREP
jgi:enoyl-[acyl-carrier protein] reductase I